MPKLSWLGICGPNSFRIVSQVNIQVVEIVTKSTTTLQQAVTAFSPHVGGEKMSLSFLSSYIPNYLELG